jgi:iron-sulfur cluster assembly protein
VTLTDAAKARVRALVADKPGMVGLRVGVKAAGCSGLTYTAELAEAALPTDRIINLGEAQLFIDTKAEMYLIGSEMDYVTSGLKSGFEFHNPNEGARCGCGESFTTKNDSSNSQH